MQGDQVSVRVPATSGNMGSGFDCLGIALDLWNHVTISVADKSAVTVVGEGSLTLPHDSSNLIYESAQAVFNMIGQPDIKISIACQNQIPLQRGLGSSAAAVVAGIIAANALCERQLDTQSMLELATSIEGHPDNVAPALLGGCQVVVRDDKRIIAESIPINADITAIVFIPDMRMPTNDARSVLPSKIMLEDVVYNLGRVAMLVNSLSGNRLENLMIATQDRLHQPARAAIFPGMNAIFQAAKGAGAAGVFLSGAGSSVLALGTARCMTIGYEMANAADKAGVTGTIKIMKPSSLGAQIIS